jgi:hypothetical protein
LVSTADPVVSTEVALGAVSPPGALTFLALGSAVPPPALAEPDGDGDGDGDAEGSRPDSGLDPVGELAAGDAVALGLLLLDGEQMTHRMHPPPSCGVVTWVALISPAITTAGIAAAASIRCVPPPVPESGIEGMPSAIVSAAGW